MKEGKKILDFLFCLLHYIEIYIIIILLIIKDVILMKTETFNCMFHGIEFQYIITSDYPCILESKSNISYLLRKRDNELKGNEEEFAIDYFQGKSNRKAYKEYTDKKGSYIKFNTGTSVKPGTIKIYKD
jgi:hypothetical protein